MDATECVKNIPLYKEVANNSWLSSPTGSQYEYNLS